MTNVLALGSCRLSFNFDKYNLTRPSNITVLHNHNEFLSIIETLNNIDYDSIVMSKYSKLKNCCCASSNN